MKAKEMKQAILVCAQPCPGAKLDRNVNAMRFVCELAGAMSVVGDAEIVAALRQVAGLPAQAPELVKKA